MPASALLGVSGSSYPAHDEGQTRDLPSQPHQRRVGYPTFAGRALEQERGCTLDTPLSAAKLQRILDRLRDNDERPAVFSSQAVREALARVLGEYDGLPPGPAEVDELIRLLRAQLVQMVLALEPACRPTPSPELRAAIEHAGRMWRQEAPPLFVDAIKYLIGLAQATAELLVYVPEQARVERGSGAAS